ncbi:hypothetical protein [Vallicoccus soli]|uniref:Uncharacterized protein n=1 Tax=Vallicoccus soli TaxID=2339232 RepID=A0A3A3YN29_9ACTN|nr:hypothetical protein [Vallicoccus soli]RJK92512.1 hypothetical protein D5H78_18720 [Vallicoccus soli]
MAEGVRLAQADPLDRWAIGDLAVEAIPPGRTRAEKSAAQRRLELFSGETGLSLGLLKDCYRTSQAWPPGARLLGISHSKHSTVANRPDRVSALLDEEMAGGLPNKLRTKVERAEELLRDPQVRAAVIDRSKTRSRRVAAAARAVEDEELVKARTYQRIQEADAKAQLAAPEILSRLAERAIRGNVALAKMVTELLDLKSVIHQVPPQYHDRTAENLTQVSRAAERALNALRPATRSPQPRDVVVISTDDQPGAEHR